MRIVYPTSTPTHWASVAGGITNTPQTGDLVVAGLLIDLGPPNYPYKFEAEVLADDRQTQGGLVYSKVRATRRQGVFAFGNIHSSKLPAWRSWYFWTQGFRIPFYIEFPDTTLVRCVAPGAFPLALVKLERWAGSFTAMETL